VRNNPDVGDQQLHLKASEGGLSMDLVLESAMNYALAHNSVSPLKHLEVINDTEAAVRGMGMEVLLDAPVDGKLAAPLRVDIPEVQPFQHRTLHFKGSAWRFDAGTFAQIDEAISAHVTARFFDSTRTLRAEATMRLLAHDEWWSLSIRESLAAFVTPRATAIRDLLSDASDLLREQTGSPSMEGYQGGAERAMSIAGAIYDAMAARQIRYINPPPSFEGTGQKIRSPHEVLVGRFGTCLDLATVYAAALEAAGLNPVLVLCDGHAFAGHLFDEQQLPELVLTDRRMVLNYVESELFVPIETTRVCDGDQQESFAGARAATHPWFTEGIDRVRCLIDVAAAHRVIRPLPAISLEGGVRVVEVERPTTPGRKAALPQPPVPEEPRARGGERPHQEFPPRVQRWRNSLLDMSFRNPLLNMKVGRTSVALHVPHGALGQLEDQLFDGQALNLHPHDDLAEIHVARGARTAQDIEPETLTAMLAAGDLYVACPQSSYLSRMRGLQRRARTVIEETGANNLFVTLGLLEWADAGRPAKAPLFLLPVTITVRRGRGFELHIEDGAYAHPNQCLLEKLRIAYGLSIPEFTDPETDESGIDLDSSLRAIRTALVAAELPFSIEESAQISLLQFSTLQLWQDLTDHWPTFARNPVVRHLIESTTDSFIDPAAINGVRTQPEASCYCPVEIDSSQLDAVAWAEAGRSFVLEGPPGTGKSQTITNLIANALAAGQTVVFVAEKQAALDVVRRRLERIGLDELCLDLHGKNQTPEDLRRQLRSALHLHCDSNAESWAATRAGFENAVVSLARYPEALHTPGGAGLSAWDARQALLTNLDAPSIEVSPSVVAAPLTTAALYARARELTDALYDLGSALDSHPWRLAQLSSDALTESRDQLGEAVRALRRAVDALDGSSAARLLAVWPGADAPAGLEGWLRTVVDAAWLIDVEALPLAARPDWKAAVDALRARLVKLAHDAAPLLGTFTPALVDAVDLGALLTRSKEADRKLFKRKPRKAILAELASITDADSRPQPGSLSATLEALVMLQSTSREIAAEARAIPGVVLANDWNPLADEAVKSFEDQLLAITATVELVGRAPAVYDVLRSTSEPVNSSALTAAERFRKAWAELLKLLEASDSGVLDWLGERPLIQAVRTELPAWSADVDGGLVSLGRWVTVLSHSTELTRAGFGAIVERVVDGSLHPDEIESALRRSVAQAALAERLAAPALGGFDGVGRDRAIERFARQSTEMRNDMVHELPAKVLAERSFSPERMVGRVGELNRELGRKRGGLKIRELFSDYGEIIAEITPCLMMSPHSVARFLPPEALEIDLAVFDEASQIRVAEAVGAMGRAKAVVVVGDSQQMPPTNIAMTTAATDEDEALYVGIPADMESVLSEAVESNLPRLWLSWHYRSKHESLIAFSNESYYDGRLASFPRPPEERHDLGVSWRRVDGTFERGRERVNRVEAAAIVEEIRSRLARDAGASVGVVTFNIQQRDLILDLLEECGDDRVAASLADEDEPLFVKNLENVQGDERDVILFSLAFSPNRETGQLPLNFGPLIQAGGEKRLNVAVTRARTQVVLFSSFDPSHIDLNRSASVGLAHLRGYMEMAERGDDAPAILRRPGVRDRHQEEVVVALRDAQLKVREHVGLSDFTVDIGVACADEGPWVAVFLDGPGYAARKTVADREVLPFGVLRSMGWSRVERIWLPDWVRDREEVIHRIRAAASAPVPTVDTPMPSSPQVSADSSERSPSPAGASAFESGESRTSRTSTPGTGRYVGRPGSWREQASQAEAADAMLVASVSPPNTQADPLPTPGRTQDPAGTPFVPAHEHVAGTREVLDEMDSNPRHWQRFGAQLTDVIVQEAPIAATRLARIVGRRFGLQRVAASRSDAIIRRVRADLIERTPFGVFVWAPGQDREGYGDFRIARGAAARSIEEIAPRELLNAMHYLAKTGLGISREELVRETAGLFGFTRMASKITAHLDAVIDYGITQRVLVDDGQSITARES
jgi:hypothetical protein